jgi:hypothetical protein
MTPEDEREAQYADELVAGLPQEARDRLLTDWGQYLVDRQQTDLPIRHRDFILGWIACYDSHELRPRLVSVTMLGPAPAPQPRPPVSRPTLYERAVETQKKSDKTITVKVGLYRDSQKPPTKITIERVVD